MCYNYLSMPISSPPQDYKLDPVGTSGIPVGPSVMIVDDDLKPLASSTQNNSTGTWAQEYGVAGNIFIRGPPCFGTY